VDFFTDNTFLLSTLGAGAAPRVLTNTVMSAEGGVCPDGAIAMVTIELRPAAGSDCPSAVPTEPDEWSTKTEGTLCSLAVSSLILCFECLGFEELPKQSQEKGRCLSNPDPRDCAHGLHLTG
jgi:hypothetical protein